jgi:serine phosphatase RsbU (regulator of sigma subunit)
MSIYIKFISLCLFLVFFTAGTFFYVANQESQKFLREQILNDLSQQSANSMRGIERFIYERISDITSLANHTAIRQAETKKDLNAYLAKLHKVNGLYQSFSFFNLERVRQADSKGLDIGKQHPKSIYWTDIEAGKDIVVDISESNSLKSNVLHFASVVHNEQGKKIGVIVSRILVEKLYEVFQEIPQRQYFKNSLNIDLVNKQGLLLYSNYNPKGVLQEHFSAVNLSSQEKMVETPEKLFFLEQEKSYMEYSGNQWRLVISIPTQKAFLVLVEVRNRIIYLLLPIVLVAVIIALWVARRLVKPISQLAKAAEQIGEENWEADTKINTHDELRTLGKQLHKMGLKLKHKIDEQKELNETLATKYDEIQAQKHHIAQAYKEIREKNNRITESITSAKRIQMAMLPDEGLLHQYFTEHLIYFAPKDIVSGDFYWFNKIHTKGRNYFVIAVADCTGHGVPGAILAMLGSNLLSNLITYQQMTDTEQILLALNKYIKEELNQNHQHENSANHDGMEIALAIIDLDERTLQFSGAGRPLYVLQEGNLVELKGDKMTIGGIGYKQKYHGNHEPIQVSSKTMLLNRHDIIYLFSDGYKDQFGSERNVKMGSTYFRQFLTNIQDENMYAQKILIDKHFQDWKQGFEQTDDVLVVGLKIA